jgi:RHS repeat-associated protein
MNLRRILPPLLVLATAPFPAAADIHPNLQRGLDAAKSLQVGDLDHVNLMNGSLNVTIPIGPRYPVDGNLSYGLVLVQNSNVWDFVEVDDIEGHTFNSAIPNHLNNSGLGWMLTLGHLEKSPDSNDWTYTGPDGSEHTFYDRLHDDEEPVPDSVFYSRDGSYLRMTELATGNQVEFPSGEIHEFWNEGVAKGELKRAFDRFGNFVKMTPSLDGLTWAIEDGHGRIQRIYFAADGFLGKRVTSVELTAFGNATATYTFGYTARDVHRPCPNTYSGTNGPISVNLLTSVTLFDGSSYSMPSPEGNLALGYHLDQSAGCRTPGSLRRLVLPTLGVISWTYQPYNFPAPIGRKVWRQLSNGVASRTLTGADGQVVGTWQYATTIVEPSPPFRQLRNTVTTPLGHRTESFFSVSLVDSEAEGWTIYEYGLPLTHSTASGTRFLSTLTYAAGSSNPLRETYVRYERDEGSGTEGDPTTTGRFNQRVASTRTLYKDDGNRIADVDMTDFDGLGHYRTSQTSGSFDSGNARISHTNYNSGNGSYPGDDFTMLGPGDKWLLATFDEQSEIEGGQVARRTFFVEPDTGWVSRIRTHRDDTGVESNKDLILERVRIIAGNPPISRGNLESERYYGGDSPAQLLGTGSLGNVSLPQPPEYRIDHATHYGTRAVSRYIQANGTAMSFKTLDCGDDPTTGVNDPGIDKWTGLRAKCRDTAGVATTFDYDKLGRTRWIRPDAGESWTELVYTAATGSNTLATINVYSRANGGGAVLAESLIKLDAFGRLWREHQKMADSSFSIRETLYDPMGWKKSVSQLGNLSKLTTYSGYDPFGRPGKVTAPDGSEVAFTYNGVSKTSRSVAIGDVVGGKHPAFTNEFYDRQGRLSEVREEAEASFANTFTTYFYDVGNRLTRSRQVTSAGTQNRFFIYDQRGFLKREEHPEKGTSSTNGKVFYIDYDARGHVGRRFECTGAAQACLDNTSPHSAQVKLTYDRAERLETVTDETVSPVRPLKTFEYGTSEAANERTNGRLLTGTRYNYQSVPLVTGGAVDYTLKIAETYAYAGPGGHTTGKTTQVTSWIATDPNNPVSGERFVQSWSYDALGNILTVGYPDCTAGSCATADTARSVSTNYNNGWLTSVTGSGGASYASAITYHPNGMVKKISRSNGVALNIGPDPDYMLRPASFFTTGAGTGNWKSGAYYYDGAGNVTNIGSSRFTYDHVSRLKTAEQYVEPQTALPFSDSFESGDFTCWAPGSCLGASLASSQTFNYDSFGNLKEVVGTNGRTIPTDSLTNRLNAAGTSYDVMGNVLTWNGDTYEYDALGMMTRRCPSGCAVNAPDWRFIYTADDERLWYTQVNSQVPGATVFTLRDLDGSTLRQYDAAAVWAIRDYIYRDGQLLASNAPGEGDRHFHLDHLGTPRLITNAAAGKVAYHAYLPFGEEATLAVQDVERRKFTGHERDATETSDVADDRDSMHARQFNPLLGRFLAVDPNVNPGRAAYRPQGWNHYAYVEGNPLRAIDPDGQTLAIATGQHPAHTGELEAGLEHLRKVPRLRVLVEGLEQSSHRHSVVMVSGDDSHTQPYGGSDENLRNGVGLDTTIYISNEQTDEAGNPIPIDEVMAHEFSHAEDADTGTKDTQSPCPDCAANNEIKAVRMENLVRPPGGARDVHGGKRVPDPTVIPKKVKRGRRSPP